MSHTKLFLLIHCGFLAVATLAAQTNQPVIFPDEDALTPENLKLVWPATPGLRYEVRQSTNLQSWSTAPGYPATASGPAQQMPFLTEGAARFFQVRELDEQPPAIVSQYPQDGGFAVPRFANLTLQLADPTGINTNSIKLTVGSLGTFTLASPQLTFSNNLLTFINGGSIPLGGWGSNVQATLVAADTAGYAATNIWSFTLELQPQVVTNLFVFGSPQAQRTGQRIGNIPPAALAARFGPMPMGDGDPWTLELVASNRLEISYTNIAPVFATNTYVCNLTPRTTDEVFYCKITSVSNAPANKLLTLFTTNVPLAEILVEGSVSLSRNSVIYQVSNNVIVKAFDYDGVIPLGPIGVNTSQTLYDQGGVTLTLNEAKFLFTPSLRLSFETRGLSLNRFEAELQGRLETALVPELTIAGSLSDTKEFELSSRKWLVFVQAVPPVWLEIDFSIGAEVGYNLTVNARMSTGVRQNMDLGFGVDYAKDRSPSLVQIHSLNPHPTEIVPFTYEINGSGSAYATIIPQIDLRVISLAGVYANVDPRVEISGSATVSNGQLTSANFGIVADADLNFGLSVLGLENDDLPALPPIRLFRREWATVYPPPVQITIRHQPQSQTVVAGDYASFTVDAFYPEPLSYQWFYGNVPIPGKTSPTLVLLNVNSHHTGPYYVRVNVGSLATNSFDATLTVEPADVPAGMVFIPAGSFQMGDSFNEGNSDELPLHTVYVSAFYMDQYEVTKALWVEVFQWATNHGYSFGNGTSGKAATHPAHSMGWRDAVTWCNARSEKEGRTPSYYTDAGLTQRYRSVSSEPYVKWNSGYRLPTEAEWEKAARGGTSERRFPWGNTISHSEANYESSDSYAYDVSATRSYHPVYYDPCSFPWTSPVGSFAPNGYGLYDMAGNVWEWCWDWYGNYGSTVQTDPRGPGASTYLGRVFRGGGWGSSGAASRTASRRHSDNFYWGTIYTTCGAGVSDSRGFRCVLPPSDKAAPLLAISSPASGSTLTASSVIVTGTASDSDRGNSGITSVTVNGIMADTDTAGGSGAANWSRTVPLSIGANTITVVATDGANNTTSISITVTYNSPPPAGMALIPAGSFQMGDNLDGDTDALPLHTVSVSAFYMERYEVTKSLWDSVYQWATNHGYNFSDVGSGKAGDHPVYGITWNDALKWCNARSEMEAKTPAYYASAARTNIYRAGVVYVQNDWVDWNAGYRLPTEAEWEKAARGGLDGLRFPWGNIITHNEANYRSSVSYGYDISTTRGYHPAYFDVCHYPGTSPVGSFSPGRYGLYDMAGNVWERCWDQIGHFGSAYQTDPRGPSSGSIYHIFRGGDWRGSAIQARVTTRQTSVGFGSGSIDFNCGINNPQYLEPIYIGFRTVLPPRQ